MVCGGEGQKLRNPIRIRNKLTYGENRGKLWCEVVERNNIERQRKMKGLFWSQNNRQRRTGMHASNTKQTAGQVGRPQKKVRGFCNLTMSDGE